MKHYVENKVIIVTGGSSGFGRESARLLLEMGAKVVIIGRNQERLDRAQGELSSDRLLAVRADAVSSADWHALIQATLDRFARLDVLVNNHGAGVKIAPVDDMEDEAIQAVIETNLISVIKGCREAVKVMKPRGSGQIVNVSSGCPPLLAGMGRLHRCQGGTGRLHPLPAQGNGRVGRPGNQLHPRRRAPTSARPPESPMTGSMDFRPEDFARTLVHCIDVPDNCVIDEAIIWEPQSRNALVPTNPPPSGLAAAVRGWAAAPGSSASSGATRSPVRFSKCQRPQSGSSGWSARLTASTARRSASFPPPSGSSGW